MINFEALLPGLLAFLVLTVSPGPANIAVALISMRMGRRKSLVFGLGLSVGFAFWGLVAATGMGALLQSSIYVLSTLKILGGLYLLWLAFQAGRTAIRGNPIDQTVPDEGRWFWRGLILNLSNPKAVLAWMATLSFGLGAGMSPDGAALQLVVATGLGMAIGLLNYQAYALAFSMPWLMRAYQRFHRWVEGSVAALFSLAGFGLIRSAFARAP
jgi:threonine efflux protein